MNQYFSQDYLSKGRFISFWHQINEVLKTKPNTVLEIGKGSGIVAEILKKYGIKVKTIDIDKNVSPDFIGDIRTYKFNEKFDTTLCAEVLEHLPFSDFEKTLRRIKKTTNKSTIITLPEALLTDFHFSLKLIPFVKEISKTIKIYDVNKFIKPDHLWEVGQKLTPLNLIEDRMTKHFHLEKSYQIKESRHRFFVLTI